MFFLTSSNVVMNLDHVTAIPCEQDGRAIPSMSQPKIVAIKMINNSTVYVSLEDAQEILSHLGFDRK